jgi:hypothetical protein
VQPRWQCGGQGFESPQLHPGVHGRRIADPRAAKRLSHVCYRTPTGIAVLDLWADEQSFAAFGAIIGPATEAAGLTSPPQVYPVQGFMSVDGLRNP